MKRLLYILSLWAIFGLTLGCDNYDEGPWFSFYSPTQRITGTWHIVDIIINDKTDQTLLNTWTEKSFTFHDDGSLTIVNPETLVGSEKNYASWNFDNDNEDIVIHNGGNSACYHILRLTSNELWVVFENSEKKSNIDASAEIHFEKVIDSQ